MIDLYIESSALLRAILDGDEVLGVRLDQAVPAIASRLTWFEAERGIRRAIRTGRKSENDLAGINLKLDKIRASCHTVELAGAFDIGIQDFPREPVRSLDALHLGAALYLRDVFGVSAIASCDDRVRSNGKALGFSLIP